MLRKFFVRTGCLVAFFSCVLAVAAEQWVDKAGNSFRGEAAEMLGPLALFRTGPTTGSKIACRYLTPADCVRFFEAIKDKPPRAEDWANARGLVSRALIGSVERVDGDRLVDASVNGLPEPEFFLLFFADNSEGKSWEMIAHSVAPYNTLQAAFPGMVAGLFCGTQHSGYEHATMATQSKVPWLVADYHEQFLHLADVMQLGPATKGDFALVVVNRDGVPLFSAPNPSDADCQKIFSQLSELLVLMRPENPHGWPDRLYYLRAVQPVAHAHDRCGPLLVGNPLLAEGLRQRKVYQVDAGIAVDADGHVTAATVAPDGEVPAAMIGPIADALKHAAIFVPAVDNGKFVDGTYAYSFKVSH